MSGPGITDVSSLLSLAGADMGTVTSLLGADGVSPRATDGYEGLTEVELVEAPGDEYIYVRDGQVALIYLSPAELPSAVTHEALVEALGTEGAVLRSRQGRAARLHVVAERGVAWSERGGEIGYVEIFPPIDLQTYREKIYVAHTFRR